MFTPSRTLNGFLTRTDEMKMMDWGFVRMSGNSWHTLGKSESLGNHVQ